MRSVALEHADSHGLAPGAVGLEGIAFGLLLLSSFGHGFDKTNVPEPAPAPAPASFLHNSHAKRAAMIIAAAMITGGDGAGSAGMGTLGNLNAGGITPMRGGVQGISPSGNGNGDGPGRGKGYVFSGPKAADSTTKLKNDAIGSGVGTP